MMNLNWTSCFSHLRLILLLGAIFSIESFAPSSITRSFSSSLNNNFVIKHSSEIKIRRYSTSYLSMAKKKKTGSSRSSAGKGFGNTRQRETTTSSSSSSPSDNSQQQQQASPPDNDYVSPTVQSTQGQVALEAMRRQRAEKKDAELRKVKTLVETDQYVKESGPGAAAIPEKVAQRMGKRMLPFVGIPLFGVMGTFVTFWYLATYKDLQFQTGLVASSTIVVLLIGLLGITYSVMSASWDPEREGSLLGIDEFEKNIGNIKSGLSRSKENLLIRERMAGISKDQINRAVDDLDRRDAKKLQKQQTLNDKLDLE